MHVGVYNYLGHAGYGQRTPASVVHVLKGKQTAMLTRDSLDFGRNTRGGALIITFLTLRLSISAGCVSFVYLSHQLVRSGTGPSPVREWYSSKSNISLHMD